MPVYPPLRKYLLEDDAYEDEGVKWQFDKFVSDENKIASQVEDILESFKQAEFKKEDMLQKYKNPSEKFDQDWDFIHSIVFSENHSDLKTKFKGHLWVKELFLISEAHVPNMNDPLIFLITTVLSFQFLIVEYCWNKYYLKNTELLVKPNKRLYLTY